MKHKKNRVIIIGAILAIVASAFAYLLLRGNIGNDGQDRQDTDLIRTDLVRMEPVAFGLNSGWGDAKPIKWHDFGLAREETGALYVLVTGFDENNQPKLVQHQKNIFDPKRGDEDYSDLRKLKYVTVPGDYQANSIKSDSELLNRDWPVKDGEKVVNQPQVLRDDTINPGMAKIEAWVDGELTYSWRFEENVPINSSDQNKALTSNLYSFVSSYDGDGSPIKVPDQLDVAENIPGDSAYSPLRRIVYVEVPADYQPNSIKSSKGIVDKGYKTNTTDILLNQPVYEVDGNVVKRAEPEQKAPEAKEALQTPKTEEKPKVIQKNTTKQISSKQTVKDKSTVVSVSKKTSTTSQTVVRSASEARVTIDGGADSVSVRISVVNISIQSGAFNPFAATITPDTTVVWTNYDSMPHCIVSDDGRFSSGVILPGESFEMIFTALGLHSYHLSTNPLMMGNVIVVKNL